ncbi:general transcription factor 3C polypeptide 1 [Ditylenchus destructor]|uniref:General transcription factor 3C polypeptide 1 n=1 Tax=Ditylenchus destructor TaxID=166010 RepID=A0AAD4MT47_9BILA|nr:general transcription factor 3C polypeptide 1 [Ditylenchus destructor]
MVSRIEANCKKAFSPIFDSIRRRGTGNVYFDYDASAFSPLFLYRPIGDSVASMIMQSSSEGLGRYEIGKRLGINTRTKSGNRKVSQYITNACKRFPEAIGQYQKMEGKFRMIKYYSKNTTPESHAKCMSQFEELVGVKCPFKMADVVKFPGTKLDTLRITDISMKRIINILSLLKKEIVIVTSARLVKYLHHKETQEGYQFAIDKKSAVKCVMALQKHKLLKMTSATATDDGEQKKFDVILSAGIETVDDPVVQEAINKVIAEFHQENRVFPTGQPRYLNAKRKANLDESAQRLETLEERLEKLKAGFKIPVDIDLGNVDVNNMSVMERFAMFRKAKITTHSVTEVEPTPMPKAKMGDLSLYGHQPKMIKLAVFHEFLFRFIHSMDIDASQPTYTLYDLFPPAGSLPDDGRPIDERYVFDDQPDSPYRYVPPLPKFRDAQRGWVLVKDIVNVIPLSLFVLVVNLKYEVPGLNDYLSDPIQRHTLIGDLPYSIRRLILTKKAYTQVEHHCLLLCVMGLACVAPNLDGNRSSIGAASLFFIARKGRLYDTSTSDKGYAGVTMPLDLYNKYEYEFNDFQDIHRYWSHLKAIAYSTHLNCKAEGEREAEEEFATSRKYTLGVIDRIPFQAPHDQIIDDAIVPPTTYRNGCAGFDPSLFVHINRHWELAQAAGVNQLHVHTGGTKDNLDWFAEHWKRSMDPVREWVMQRVAQLNTSWSSYVVTLMPTDGMLFRKKIKEAHASANANRSEISMVSGISYFRRVTKLRGTKRKPAPSPSKDSDSSSIPSPSKKVKPRRRKSAKAANEELDLPGTSAGTQAILNLARLELANKEREDREMETRRTVLQPGTSSETRGVDFMASSSAREESPPPRRIPFLPAGSKKRPFDEVDQMCRRMSLQQRSKFSPKEKDMLLLIRGVSYFLNPVHRFWLDPTVMRQVMHKYVPESQNKTANSLMAAGAKDLVHPHRLAYVQYIIKTLGSYLEMREIRSKAVGLSHKQKMEERTEFFLKAFEIAYNLLFKESESFPSITAPDSEFDKYIEDNNLKLTLWDARDPNAPQVALPQRCSKPTDVNSVQHCIGYNIATSILLNDSSRISNSLPEQVDPFMAESLLSNVNTLTMGEILEQARKDGLIVRLRSGQQRADEQDHATLKKQAVCSGYYRNFFNHRYHSNIMELIVDGLQKLETNDDESRLLVSEDEPGYLLGLLHYLEDKEMQMNDKFLRKISENHPDFRSIIDRAEYEAKLRRLIEIESDHSIKRTPADYILHQAHRQNVTAEGMHKIGTEHGVLNNLFAANCVTPCREAFLSVENVPDKTLDIELTVPQKIEELFKLGEETEGKDESEEKDLNATKRMRELESAKLEVETIRISPKEKLELVSNLPDFDSVFTNFVRRVPIAEINKTQRGLGASLAAVDATEQKTVKQLFEVIESSGIVGASEDEIVNSTNLDPDRLKMLLECMCDTFDIFSCGIDTRRYVAMNNAKSWMVITSEYGFFPRPWTLPSGEINYPILRWMAEAVLVAVHSQPGIPMEELEKSFVHAVQPILIEELLSLLESLGSCSVQTKSMKSMVKTSPFAETSELKTIRYVMPMEDCLERFAVFFKSNNGVMKTEE